MTDPLVFPILLSFFPFLFFFSFITSHLFFFHFFLVLLSFSSPILSSFSFFSFFFLVFFFPSFHFSFIFFSLSFVFLYFPFLLPISCSFFFLIHTNFLRLRPHGYYTFWASSPYISIINIFNPRIFKVKYFCLFSVSDFSLWVSICVLGALLFIRVVNCPSRIGYC